MLWRSLCLVILRGRPDQNVIDNFRRIYSQTVYHLIPMLCRSCGSFSLHVDRCPFCRWRAEIRAFIVCYLCGSFQSIWYAQRTVQLCRILVPLGIWGESSALYNFWRTPASRSPAITIGPGRQAGRQLVGQLSEGRPARRVLCYCST